MMGAVWREIEMRRLLLPSQQWTGIAPTGRYMQVTVRLWGKGVVPRGEVSGAEIAATQQRNVRAGQFIISKIDARNGAFGLVPAELDGAVVSNDFPVFDINRHEAEPRFVEWLSKTSKFVDLCRRASEGSTNRVRLTEGRFLSLPVAIPDLLEQRRIVARLDRVERLAKDRQATIEAMDVEVEAMLRSAFDRITEGAPMRPMAEVAPLVRRPVEVRLDGAYPELGVRSFGRGTFHKPSLPGTDVGAKKLFFIQPGDLVFNIVFAWEGAVAVATERDADRVGSHRFLTCVPSSDVATADFLRFYFLTPEGLAKLQEASPGGAGRNRTLGLQALAAIRVPTPSLDQQLWFDHLQGKVREMRTVREQAARDANALLPAMLHEIFGNAEGA